MINWIAGRARCIGGRHERSEKHAQRIGGDDKYVSKCRYCGVHMTRRAKRDWIVTPKAAR
ncbi:MULTISPECIES: hypothetical protein [unclassified Sphingomonas]|uniref:hypothetical protein n=1 Tax=unclassified Sphingomonas TaxID=196159 RepID=UPI0022B500C5|nr:hypothetical protein [Sphingomonas sp. NIBR02145]WHU02026.1 hypothetical protein O3305_17800 [Sphingomonas sp. NIBR02145]